ncbi:MAG: hybrid sensor histidine kinase/response regulator [Proteobacteria bacterium]|nr:hybrid sensor histidine kinase/response regulator [Pseudomonadota bacterium]
MADKMQAGYKILVVDDIDENIELLEGILEDEYILATVKSGEEALAKLPAFRPDLILLDVTMPGMDGYEVCLKIREDQRYRYIKIILVTAKSMVEERLHGYEVGADDYVTKPFVAGELVAKIKVFLKLKRSEEIDRLKTDLLVLFSHETRTPLNSIIVGAELLQGDPSLSDSAKSTVDLIIDGGKRLLGFIEKTMLLCHLKSGVDLDKYQQYMAQQLKSTIQNYEAAAMRKNVAFDLEVSEDSAVSADWSMFHHALGNVLDNAVKFSPEGGTIHIGQTTADGKAIVKISDHGRGIRPEWIDKIFDEFAIQDITHHQKGQGLGLAISKKILELHGGFITVESVPNEGSTFILGLPLE